MRLIIFYCVLFLTMAGCAKSPYTNRNQFMIISQSEEVSLGEQSSKEYKNKEQIISNGPEADRIIEVGLRIAAAVNRPDMTWEFLLVKSDDTLNAFALPGGKVFVYTGLLNLAESDAELATVMSHEIAHVLARHGAERLSTQMLISLGAQAGAMAINIESPAMAEVFSQAYGVGINVGLVLPFSRNQESEADYIGLILMSQAGYDPEAALSFWQKMAEANKGDAVPALLSTHPTTEGRIDAIRKALPEVKAQYWKR